MAEDSKSVLKMFKEEVGESYRVDDLVDPDIACEIVEKFNHTAKRVSDTNREKDLFFIEGRESLPKNLNHQSSLLWDTSIMVKPHCSMHFVNLMLQKESQVA